MADLLFVTTNPIKLQLARTICRQYGRELSHQPLEMTEIQSDEGEQITRGKAEQAYEHFQQPVIVTDDSWSIPGLHGFPGPYMKAMNNWLTPTDFLNLTRPLKDRRIIMSLILVYQDEFQKKVFRSDLEGTLLTETRGTSVYPHSTVISFDNGQHSAAEEDSQVSSSLAARRTAWHELCDWLASRQMIG